MTSDRKLAANRRNGRRSRGPRTPTGKALVSRNALRHGLAVSILSDPVLRTEVEKLAHAIAGAEAADARLAQARLIAEAQLDLARIEDAKVTLLNSQILEGPRRAASAGAGDAAQDSGSTADDASQQIPNLDEVALVPSMEVLQELARLERYERRAISRRTRAIRVFLFSDEFQEPATDHD